LWCLYVCFLLLLYSFVTFVLIIGVFFFFQFLYEL